MAEPWDELDQWLVEARDADADLWNAAALATADAHGTPSARMVLVKAFDRVGAEFFTNRESRKASDLAARPRAALCFHWPASGRQLRVEGMVDPLPDARSDAYFATRDRASQVGAWASQQSRELREPQLLVDRIAAVEQAVGDNQVHRPPHWGGYVLIPSMIEFWTSGAGRLHERREYRLINGRWKNRALYP